MSIFMTLRIALKALGRNKLRTTLTMLGMIIGVGGGHHDGGARPGAQATIEEQVKSAGTNMITINAGNFTQRRRAAGPGNSTTLMPEDAEAHRADVPGVQYVAAGVNTPRRRSSPATRTGRRQIQGTDVDFPLIRSWPMKYGSFFTPQDVTARPRSPCSARSSPDTLFGDGRRSDRPDHPRPQPALQGDRRHDRARAPSAMGQDQDDAIFAPYTTVQKKLQGMQHINRITVSAATADTAPVAAVDQRDAAHCATSSSATIPTTSWSARWKTWPRPHGNDADDDDAAGRHRRRLAASSAASAS